MAAECRVGTSASSLHTRRRYFTFTFNFLPSASASSETKKLASPSKQYIKNLKENFELLPPLSTIPMKTFRLSPISQKRRLFPVTSTNGHSIFGHLW
jgi:hypothetical protein